MRSIRLLAVLLGALIAALALDRLIATLVFANPGRYVPTYRSSYHPSVGVKLDQLRTFDGLDGVFLGNSLAMMAVDPAAFDARIRGRGRPFRSYNLAVPGVGVQFWPRFVREYLDDTQPEIVLLGVQARDVSARGEQITALLEPRFYGSNAYVNRDLGRLDRTAEELLSRIFVLWGRNGDLLRAIGGLRHGEKYDPDDLIVKSTQGWSQSAPQFERSREELLDGERQFGRRHGPDDFAVSDSAKSALKKLNAWVLSDGGRLVLFTMPALYDSEPEGTVEVQRAFLRAMRELTVGLPGAAFLDMGSTGSFTWEDYSDENHFNQRGAVRFSGLLADAVEDLQR
jgi:hypothetical protein